MCAVSNQHFWFSVLFFFSRKMLHVHLKVNWLFFVSRCLCFFVSPSHPWEKSHFKCLFIKELKNVIENFSKLDQAVFMLWIKTVKIMFWSVLEEPLGFISIPFLSSLKSFNPRPKYFLLHILPRGGHYDPLPGKSLLSTPHS